MAMPTMLTAPTAPTAPTASHLNLGMRDSPTNKQEPNPIAQTENQVAQPDQPRPYGKPPRSNNSAQISGTSPATGRAYPNTAVGEPGVEPAHPQGHTNNQGRFQDADRRNQHNSPNHQEKGRQGKPSSSGEHKQQPNGQSPYSTPMVGQPGQGSTPNMQPIPGYQPTAGPMGQLVMGQDTMGMAFIPMLLPDGQITYGIVLNNQIYPGQMMYGGMGVSDEYEYA